MSERKTVLGPDIPATVDSRFAGLADSVRSGWFLQDSDELYSGVRVDAGDTVLDVGCGEGAVTLFSAQRGARVIFTDQDEAVVTALAERVREQGSASAIQPLVSDTDPLELADGLATKVVCMEVLEHVAEPAAVMRELVRVGRPGAQYLLTVPGASGEQMQRHFAPPAYFQAPNHLRIFEREDFTALVRNAGLTIEHYACSGFYWVFWMGLYWATRAAAGEPLEGAIHAELSPPFDPALDQWASLWLKLTSTEQGLAFKRELDQLLPKNQIIVARKP